MKSSTLQSIMSALGLFMIWFSLKTVEENEEKLKRMDELFIN